MPESEVEAGSKLVGYTEIRDGEGNLLVAFNSEETDDYWTNEYQKERIKYCMKHREKIPVHLRTGEKPLLTEMKREARRLRKLDKEE